MSTPTGLTPAACHVSRYFTLRNPHSGLVLEGTSPYVTIQHYTGTDAQLWYLEYLDGGLVYIINKSNGKVIDVENWKALGNTNVLLREKIGLTGNICPADEHANAACQKWYIHYKSVIVNACAKSALEIRDFVYNPGAIPRTWGEHDGDNQIFTFQYV
ncbi:hypothetical protein Zmor_020010 [Zophobas morio]|uniref:Ricin B lectin domain-containing protein n=2 Tax=Zophobas morio TaxID=2755281 RepID=A0AA38M9J4_9CUCU|nr:hypothetical protein Zmor_020010 [Zophobas morio]